MKSITQLILTALLLFNKPILCKYVLYKIYVNLFNAYNLILRPLLHLYVYAIGLGPRPSYIFPLTKTACEMGK